MQGCYSTRNGVVYQQRPGMTDPRNRTTHIETRVASAAGIKIRKHPLKSAGGGKISKKRGVLPMCQPWGLDILFITLFLFVLGVKRYTWYDQPLIVISNFLEFLSFLRRASFYETEKDRPSMK